MIYTVFGAGSVGTVLAAFLAEAGVSVRIAGRGAVGRLVAIGEEERVEVEVPVVQEPEGTILLCVHEPDVAALCARWRGRTVVTLQNGVGAEAAAAEHCDTIGGVWRMTCTLQEPGRALFVRRGRVIVGRADPARDLAAAGLDVGVSDDIRRDKWLKLFVNLTSAPNALISPSEHAQPEFGALKAALLEEARDVYRAAGIDARSCDGRDPSLDEEIERQRTGLARGGAVRNGFWRQLARGRTPPLLYHDTIVALAERHGGRAPRNAAMLELARAARTPECYSLKRVWQATQAT